MFQVEMFGLILEINWVFMLSQLIDGFMLGIGIVLAFILANILTRD